ncbi:MAG: two-component regulator propeller domain-containing protein [Chitinophagaceae bacterium]
MVSDTNHFGITYRDGAWKYDGAKITHINVQENAKDITLYSIYKDNNGKLWLGTHKNGVYIYNNGVSFEKIKL